MSEALIQVVDENDAPLRGGTMDEVQLKGFWHRIVRVEVYDTETNRWLLQKVPKNPYYDGGLWNTTSSGHVDVGESYLDAAIRETEEEVGVIGLELREVDRYKTEQRKIKMGNERIYLRHNVTYLARIAASSMVIIPNQEEVEEIIWPTSDELRAMRLQSKPPLTDGLMRFVDTYLKEA